MDTPTENPTSLFCITRADQAVIAHPRFVRAHREQLQHVRRRFYEAGWTCTVHCIRGFSDSLRSAAMGYLRLHDRTLELKVNYSFGVHTDSEVTTGFGVLGRPRGTFPAESSAGFRILHGSRRNFGRLPEILSLPTEDALEVLAGLGLFDLQDMLPATRMQQALTCTDP